MEFGSPPACLGNISVRRNPTRKARATPASNLRDQSTYSSSAAVASIPPFPVLPESDPEPPPPVSNSSLDSENLRVFLRIRPLDAKSRESKNGGGALSRSRGKPPKKVEKKKNDNNGKANEICLVAIDSTSVALTPPQSLIESKRLKNEVYEGFSRVFSSDSAQEEVYDAVMEPLVKDFMGGKSGLLAAMGPTGSGKTHTVFGTPREPGLVSRALGRLFVKEKSNVDSELSRSYYISMFEIYSERGKGERIFDLSSDGADVSLQQSTIKNLQEVKVSNVAEAECVIARGMLRRTTAETNANNQSSASKLIEDEIQLLSNNAVLTIVDLAGAEREKKTGNQGARLLESNFINNTSMIFGLCLRSLLEHQKNSKKPLQRHCQNSLLTRYLRDYLEGKKRMTLILTVKPGEEDYLDTSLLLRQASPYMKIKYSSIEILSATSYQKRSTNTVAITVNPKRRKCIDMPATMANGVKDVHLSPIKEKNHEHVPPKVMVSSHESLVPNEEYHITLQKMERRDQIMQDFSKALWKVLKEYKQKLEVSEEEVRTLKESLKENKFRFTELEKELQELRSNPIRNDMNRASFRPKLDLDTDFCVSTSPYLESSEMFCQMRTYDTVVVDSSFSVEKCKSRSCECEDQKHKGILGKIHDGETYKRNHFDANYISSNDVTEETGCGNSVFVGTCTKSQILVVDNHSEMDVSVEQNPLANENFGHEKTETILGTAHDDEQLRGNDSEANYILADEIAALWWESYGYDTPELQRFAIRVLRLTCRATGCEQNWSVFDLIHSKRRNRLEQKRLNALVFVKYNLQLEQRELSRRGENRNMDPICLSDMESDDEWITETEDPTLPLVEDAWAGVSECFATQDLEATLKKPRKKSQGRGSTVLVSSSQSQISTVDDNCVIDSSVKRNLLEKEEENLPKSHASVNDEDGSCTQKYEVREVPRSERKQYSSTKSLNVEKPKRRLLPAAAMLLKDIGGLGVEDESSKAKQREKKSGVEERGRSQGSISLARLLKSNLHL